MFLPKDIQILCPKPHYPELPQLSKKTLLYLSCWQPPLPVSIKDQPEITCLSGGDKATVAGSTLWLAGPAGGLTRILGCLPLHGPAELPLLGDTKALLCFPRAALQTTPQEPGSGMASVSPGASEATGVRQPQLRPWVSGKALDFLGLPRTS